MSTIIIIIVGRVLASPLVNVFQKRLANRNVSPELIVMISYMFFVLLSVPVFIILQPFDLPREFWFYIVLLGVFDIFGNMFLVKSLKTIDLSLFGPLNSYKPIFALIFGALMLGEIPSTMGLIGVAIIVFGSYFLNYTSGKIKLKWVVSRGIIFRFLAIILTSIAAVFSKRAILVSSPVITLIYWSAIGWPISILLLMKINPSWKSEFKRIFKHFWQLIFLFLSFLALQLFTLLTFEKVFVGYSLALFQLSSVVSVFFGFHFFQERNFKFRLIGSIIMVMGVMLIVFFG